MQKMRHLVLKRIISPAYLDHLFSTQILPLFDPQTVIYNGGVANVKEWKISCYLEVMDGGVPFVPHPHLPLKDACWELLNSCNFLFQLWYTQQHCCNSSNRSPVQVQRLMTFITRYTAKNPGEEALLKHIDGAGKVDGSLVLALPTDRWTATTDGSSNNFEGYGGGLTFWDGKSPWTNNNKPQEILYDTRCGDVAFIDRGVWHQANPITRGTRWALVIFYKVL
jgi:hypothetical protein